MGVGDALQSWEHSSEEYLIIEKWLTISRQICQRALDALAILAKKYDPSYA